LGHIPSNSGRIIDAAGMVVAPGFVDLHNHSDFTILAYPDAESYVMQGVTTVVVGNCGLSLAPVNPENLALLKRYLSPFLKNGLNYNWEWRTLAEFYDEIARQGTSMNLVPLVGQGAIRLAVKGFDLTRVTEAEMKQMKKLLAQSLEDGAFGISTGLIYPPGSYSSTEELIELMGDMREYGAIYTTHMRNEGDRIVEAVEEAIKIAETNGIPLEISHHKVTGKSNWGRVKVTLRLMEQARQRGVEVNCDVYPYTAGSTTVTALLPTSALEGGVGKMLDRLKDRQARQLIKKEIAAGPMGSPEVAMHSILDEIVIAECPSKREYEGKSLGNIMRKMDKFDGSYDCLLDFFLEIEGNATIISFMMDEDDVRTVISSPLASFVSDSWVTAPRAGGKPHPRGYGAFPRFLGRYVREEKLLKLEQAVRKMTSLPAGKMDLKSRGILKEGFWADIVIFEPAVIKDKATFDAPHQYPEGINYVIVNGQVVVDRGKLTGVRSGTVVRR
jgi:N-acyl-D-aspartate/D-glutamate deacylase